MMRKNHEILRQMDEIKELRNSLHVCTQPDLAWCDDLHPLLYNVDFWGAIGREMLQNLTSRN